MSFKCFSLYFHHRLLFMGGQRRFPVQKISLFVQPIRMEEPRSIRFNFFFFEYSVPYQCIFGLLLTSESVVELCSFSLKRSAAISSVETLTGRSYYLDILIQLELIPVVILEKIPGESQTILCLLYNRLP